jgi:hypothetical protein
MGRMTGTRMFVLTAVLFGTALVMLLGAVLSHSAIPLFVMWLPLLTVPLVLGRPDPRARHEEADEGSRPDTTGDLSATSEPNSE